jgi:hypothetical protein
MLCCRKVIKLLGWRGVKAVNITLIAYGIILVGFTSTTAVMNLVKLSNTFGVFPECYGCAAYRRS